MHINRQACKYFCNRGDIYGAPNRQTDRSMLSTRQIRRMLGDRNLAEVARRTGISYGTLRNLAAGQTTPARVTRVVLTEYLTRTDPCDAGAQ